MENLRTPTLAARKKTILVLFLIINYSLLITNCFSQQWRVFTTANSPLPSNTLGGIIKDKNNVKWIGTTNGLVRIEGNNWQIFDTNNTPCGTNGIYPTALDSLNNIWCVLTGKGVAKYDGFNWTIYNSTNSGLPNNNNVSISIDKDNNKWICTPGLIKFDDFNWTIYNSTNSGIPNNVVTSVAIEGHIKWVATFSLSGGMAKFNDTNWIIYNTGNSSLPSNAIRHVGIDKDNNKWICMDFGGLAEFNSILNNWTIYNSTNSGLPENYTFYFKNKDYVKYIGMSSTGLVVYNDTNWTVFNTLNSPIPNNFVNKIEVDLFNNIWIITHGGLAVYNPNNIIGINNEIIKIPKCFVLYQNYPNPFNPTTNIKYSLPRPSEGGVQAVKLIIYDITGREIAVLVNEEQKHGDYEVNWNASNYTSGVYFYTFLADGFSESKKMILLK